MRHLHDGVPADTKGRHGQDAASLMEALVAELQPGDRVLIKGSHGSGMWKLVEQLQTAVNKEKIDAV